MRGAGGALALLCCLAAVAAPAPSADPGARKGAPDVGGPLAQLSPEDLASFWKGWEKFRQPYSVTGSLERGAGLGPSFNGLSCAQCHAQPAAGGSSSSPSSPQVHRVVMRNERPSLEPQPNPQVGLASLHREGSPAQPLPPFIAEDGPVRVARFIRHADGSPDGSVHAVFTIAGRVDAPGCALQPPDFAAELARGNVVFRVPTPIFGGGLIEAVSDADLEANLAASVEARRALGIAGRFNRTDGPIGRFGWKAQIASLTRFAAESQNTEIGVTNQLFPAKQATAPGCLFNALPEDPGRPSDVEQFATFMRFSAPPHARTLAAGELRGQQVFARTGCALCHTDTLRASSTVSGLSGVTFHPYSDFALHHMGPALADHITQGLAGGDEFRTAPLWGLGQRIFLLHDGRTGDLRVAIAAHASGSSSCGTAPAVSEACASEANSVVRRFEALSDAEQSELLRFLRSL